NALGSSPRKIIVDSLSMDKKDANELAGTMSLKIFSLEGIAQANPNIIHIETASNSGDFDPFQSFSGFNEGNSDTSGNSDTKPEITSPDVKEGMRKELLHEFDYKSYDFIPSSTLVTGNVMP